LIEKRKMQRFPIAISAIAWPQAENRDRNALQLISRDVSAAGAFFLTPTPLDLGTKARVVMFLELDVPDQIETSKAQVTLSGFITRVEKTGMAIRFGKKYKISPISQYAPMMDLAQEII
jgi:hypothetical protein